MKKRLCIALIAALCLCALPGAAQQAPSSPAPTAQPQEAAPETDPTAPAASDPTAQAETDPTAQAVERAILQALAAQAQSAQEIWEKYLLSQPLQGLRVEEGSASFSLPAWDPGVESLTGAEESWLESIWRSVERVQVEGQVRYEAGPAGEISLKGLDSFVAQVKKAADYAKGQFDLTQVRKAIVAQLLPSRLYGDGGQPTPAFQALIQVYQGTLTQAQLEAALSAQKSASLGVSDGPQALRLVFYAGQPQTLAQAALEQARTDLAAMDRANALSPDEIALIYAHAYAQQGQAFREGGQKGEKQAIVLDFQQMMTKSLYQQDFVDYVLSMTPDFEQKIAQLTAYAQSLPDYPPREQPATGVLESQANQEDGTLLILRAQDDGQGRYVALVDPAGQTALTAFLRAGESCRAYVPEGDYTLLCATGTQWYGPVRMFDQAGSYSASQQPLTILDSSRYHTLTLGAQADVPMTQAQPSQFPGVQAANPT